MAFHQHVMGYPDWIAGGGWAPDIAAGDDWIVNACITDTDIVDDDGQVVHAAGAVVWANFWPAHIDPAQAVNPDIPATDWRP